MFLGDPDLQILRLTRYYYVNKAQNCVAKIYMSFFVVLLLVSDILLWKDDIVKKFYTVIHSTGTYTFLKIQCIILHNF